MNIVDASAFRARHGKPVRDGNRLYYPDGAQEWQDSYGVRLEEPPDGHTARLELVRRYHLAALKLARAEWSQCRYAVLLNRGTYRWNAANYGPGPATGDEALARLETEVRRHEGAVTALDRQLDELRGQSWSLYSPAYLPESVLERPRQDMPGGHVSEHQEEYARELVRVAPARLLASDGGRADADRRA